MDHLTPEELDALLIGAPLSDPAGFRRHLAECATCARRLAARARFEEQLEQAANRAAAGRARRTRIAWAAAAAFVLFTAAGLAIRFGSRPTEVASSPPATVSSAPISFPVASVSPGWGARIPRLCDDVISPTEICLRRTDTEFDWPAHEALPPPGAAGSTP
jgi:hypothetical protein